MLPVVTTIPTILAAITQVVAPLGTVFKNAPLLFELANKMLPQVVKMAESISAVLDVIRPGETAEELGAKAAHAEKKPADFDSINQYVDYLRNDINIRNIEPSDGAVVKTTRQVLGCSLLVQAVSEKLDIGVSLPFVTTVSNTSIGAEVVVEMLKQYSSRGLDMDDLAKYLSNELSIDLLDKHGDVLIDAYKVVHPDLNDEQIEQQIVKATSNNSAV